MISLQMIVSLCMAALVSAASEQPLLRTQQEVEVEQNQNNGQQGARQLIFDTLYPTDICNNVDENTGKITYGPCNTMLFPNCPSGSRPCFNRKALRDHFHADNRQPLFFIDYSLVKCYPDEFNNCSSCTPGRYCQSENRCILDEVDYPCAVWM